MMKQHRMGLAFFGFAALALAGCSHSAETAAITNGAISDASAATAPAAPGGSASADQGQGDAKGAGVSFSNDSFIEGPEPDIAFQSVSGKAVSLKQFKGKVVLIDFWAPWCPPCRAGLPFTQRMDNELKSRGLVVLAVSDDPKKSVVPFIKKNHYTFTPYLDDGSAAAAFAVTGIPKTIIIDRKGNVVQEELGLVPQSETIKNLKDAGLDVSGFAPKDDPLSQQS